MAGSEAANTSWLLFQMASFTNPGLAPVNAQGNIGYRIGSVKIAIYNNYGNKIFVN
jgi:hypothetical protein